MRLLEVDGAVTAPPDGASELAFAVVALVAIFICAALVPVLIWRRIEARWREMEDARHRDLALLAKLAQPARRQVRGFLAHEADGVTEPPTSGVMIVYWPEGGDDVTVGRERATARR